MKKFLLGIIVSAIVIVLLAYKFDFSGFSKIGDRIQYNYLIMILISQIFGLIMFSIRWHYLLESKLNLKHAISSTFIGYAANMVLPARGGDFFRVYYCRYETRIPSFNLLSKLFIEKAVDFVFVILIGVASFAFLESRSAESTGSIFTISGILVACIFLGTYLLRFQNTWLRDILSNLFNLVKKKKFYEEHIDLHIQDMEEFLKLKNFIKPFIFTIITWFGYLMNYYFVAKMLQVELNLFELCFTLFLGAMSLAVPSAPSGIGVFHASVVSAFLIMGKSDSEGLIFATAAHLLSFLIVTSFGLLFYLYWTYRRRHGHALHDSIPEEKG